MLSVKLYYPLSGTVLHIYSVFCCWNCQETNSWCRTRTGFKYSKRKGKKNKKVVALPVLSSWNLLMTKYSSPCQLSKQSAPVQDTGSLWTYWWLIRQTIEILNVAFAWFACLNIVLHRTDLGCLKQHAVGLKTVFMNINWLLQMVLEGLGVLDRLIPGFLNLGLTFVYFGCVNIWMFLFRGIPDHQTASTERAF